MFPGSELGQQRPIDSSMVSAERNCIEGLQDGIDRRSGRLCATGNSYVEMRTSLMLSLSDMIKQPREAQCDSNRVADLCAHRKGSPHLACGPVDGL
jgi:hypothetical protein